MTRTAARQPGAGEAVSEGFRARGAANRRRGAAGVTASTA